MFITVNFVQSVLETALIDNWAVHVQTTTRLLRAFVYAAAEGRSAAECNVAELKKPLCELLIGRTLRGSQNYASRS